jgi:hypothetical protein
MFNEQWQALIAPYTNMSHEQLLLSRTSAHAKASESSQRALTWVKPS